MVNTLFTLVLATLLVLSAPPISARPVAPMESVAALQHQGRTFCSTFYLGSRYWATAAHCPIAALERGFDVVTIKGHDAWPVYIDSMMDIGVYESDAVGGAVKFAKSGPKVGDKISIVGYPYGITKSLTMGVVAARNIPILHPAYKIHMASDILDITVAGGNSGSPVFNDRGEVVGVLWGSFVDSPHALSIPWEGTMRALRLFLQGD